MIIGVAVVIIVIIISIGLVCYLTKTSVSYHKENKKKNIHKIEISNKTNESIGGDACFYIFAGICAFGTFFCLLCLPESSGELDQNILDKEEKEFAAEADKIVKSKTKGVHVDV